MYPLREIVHTATFQQDYATTFDFMLSKLKESNICVETQDKAKGVIVARCLTLVMNLILWRVWGDKLLFQLTKIGPTTTQVKASAVPNLLRYKVGKNEKTTDLRKLMPQIFG